MTVAGPQSIIVGKITIGAEVLVCTGAVVLNPSPRGLSSWETRHAWSLTRASLSTSSAM